MIHKNGNTEFFHSQKLMKLFEPDEKNNKVQKETITEHHHIIRNAQYSSKQKCSFHKDAFDSENEFAF